MSMDELRKLDDDNLDAVAGGRMSDEWAARAVPPLPEGEASYRLAFYRDCRYNGTNPRKGTRNT